MYTYTRLYDAIYVIQDLIYFFNFREKEISNSGSPKRWEIEVQYNCITCTINNLYIVWSIYKTFVECTCSQSLIKGIILLECLNVAITCTVCIMDMFTPTHMINVLVRAGTKVGKQPLELHQQIWTNVCGFAHVFINFALTLIGYKSWIIAL